MTSGLHSHFPPGSVGLLVIYGYGVGFNVVGVGLVGEVGYAVGFTVGFNVAVGEVGYLVGDNVVGKSV